MSPPPADGGGVGADAADAGRPLYLDTSVLVALVVPDVHTARADAALDAAAAPVVVSDFAAAEVASAVARLVRTGELTTAGARAAFSDFDAWVARVAGGRLATERSDVAVAEAFLRLLDTGLRTPDALNVAIAQRLGAALLTFDAGMAAGARLVGARLAPLPPPPPAT